MANQPITDPNITPQEREPTRHSHVSHLWLSLVLFVILLLLLLIFILQNTAVVKIHYLGFHGSIGFGVALLLAGVIGAILTMLIGSARIIQLRLRQHTPRQERKAP